MADFDITIRSLKVIENGRLKESEKGNSLLGAKLFYPRSGKPLVEAIKTLELQDNVAETFEGARISDRRLFFENISIQTDLEILISDLWEPSHFQKIGSQALRSAIKAGASAATAGLGSVVVAGVDSLGGSAIDELFSTEEQTTQVAYGSLPIDPDNILDGDVTIPLTAGEDFEFKKFLRRKQSPITTIEAARQGVFDYKKGDQNGEIVLNFRRR